MPKFFDIIPPQHKKSVKHKSRKNYQEKLIWIFLIILVLLFFYFLIGVLSNVKISGETHIVGPAQTTATPSAISPTQNQNSTTSKPISVRIINASDKPENIDQIVKTLTDNGFTVEQTTTVDNRYDQTQIYYSQKNLLAAQKLQSALQDNFQANLNESDTLGQTYDLLLIIGQK
jgi:hypothetical protein